MSNTVPVPIPDPDRCQLDWCTNRRGHTDNHVGVVGVVEPTAWSNVQAVLVTVEAGRGEVDPLPVVGLVGKSGQRLSARMEWHEAGTLANLLGAAVEAHDPDAVVARKGGAS